MIACTIWRNSAFVARAHGRRAISCGTEREIGGRIQIVACVEAIRFDCGQSPVNANGLRGGVMVQLFGKSLLC